MARRDYGALLTTRRDVAAFRTDGPSPFRRCEVCTAGNHIACHNRTYDRDSNSWTDCYCHYMGHKKRGER